jgi:hypothetical protein
MNASFPNAHTTGDQSSPTTRGKITDEQVARARRMRRGRSPYTWTQIADFLHVSVTDLIIRADRTEARKLGLSTSNPSAQRRVAASIDQPPLAEWLGENRSGGRPSLGHSLRASLAEFFYEIFDEMLFADHAVFERTRSIRQELKSSLKKGQTLTGFFMGDPLPGRSALDRKTKYCAQQMQVDRTPVLNLRDRQR